MVRETWGGGRGGGGEGLNGTSETASPAASDEVTTSTTATCNEAYMAMWQIVVSVSLMILRGVVDKWACSKLCDIVCFLCTEEFRI